MSATTRPADGRREHPPRRCSTEECHHRADAYLTDLIGAAPDDLCWDPIHQLQGHAHLGDCELIVIAPRDDEHGTIVLTAEDWDAIRHTPVETHTELLDQLAIHDHAQLVACQRAGSAQCLPW
jgi:hypothetical protein